MQVQNPLQTAAEALASAADSPSSPDSCFPATARVSLENGKTIKMAELQPGEKVKAGTHELFCNFLSLVST